MSNKSEVSRVVWYKSLGFSILFWFVFLSLVPLLLISYESYIESVKGFKEAAFEDLKHTAKLEKKFIDNWFYYREVDLSTWSQTKVNIDFLTLLISEFKESSKSLDEFVKSDEYADTINKNQGDLLKLTQNYDYIYDLFLIDNDGNILFTVAQEDDLGKNLLNGSHSSTKFASSFSQTLKDAKSHFSDLELYKSSNNMLTGFLTAAMIDDSGNQIGVLAIQLKAKYISELLNDGVTKTSNYLLSKNGLLINDMVSKTFNSEVETYILREWYDKNLEISHKVNKEEIIPNYINPFSNIVIGKHHYIDILGVKWILFSELNEDSIYTIANKVFNKAFLFFLITIFFLLIVSFIISRRIAKPIKSLSDASIKFSKSEKNINLNLSFNGEIGQLESAFKVMIDSLNKNEEQINFQTIQAKKTLRELKEQKFALDAHSIVATTNVKGGITYVNDKFIEISGYSREELMGSDHRIINSEIHSQTFWERMYFTISRGDIWHDEVCNLSKDGKYYWVDTTIVPFMGENNKPNTYIAIRTNITAAKELELELIKANEIAKDSLKAKSEFLATMSHEIRTPMNGVIGMLGLLMKSKLDNTQKRQTSLAKSSAKALLSLINDILDFSKVEAGKMELEQIDFNIRDEIGAFAEAIAVKSQEKDIELILDLSGIKLDIINSDPGRIRQILFNIVGNAIKFTSNGSICIRANLKKQNEKQARLIFEISDTGIGIPKDKIDKLFDSFSQVDASTTRKYGGTGLGLSIVKKLCEMMNGTVNVDSEYGQGSRFIVDIEVGLSKKSSLVKPSFSVEGMKILKTKEPDVLFVDIKIDEFDLFIPKSVITKDLFYALNTLNDDTSKSIEIEEEVSLNLDTNILLVEDNLTNQLVANGVLSSFGLNADIANNGLEALEILKNSDKKYDLVLMDCQMPELDGYDTTRAIRNEEAGKEYTDIPIVAMTANAMQGDKEKCELAGMNDYISKPFESKILKQVLKKWTKKSKKILYKRYKL
jgi:PAS domain S-box-containing protein